MSIIGIDKNNLMDWKFGKEGPQTAHSEQAQVLGLGIPPKEEGVVADRALRCKIQRTINRAFWISFGLWASYNLLDKGASNLLALETLIHGTGLKGYIGINMFGADPNFGGCQEGSTVFSRPDLRERVQGYFHVFKDSELLDATERCPDPAFLQCDKYVALLAKAHAILSSLASFEDIPGGWLWGSVVGWLIPTLRFRFKPNVLRSYMPSAWSSFGHDVHSLFPSDFHNDPDYGGVAYQTRQPISSMHLGFTGTITQGLDGETLVRMSSRPDKVVLGIYQLFLAGVIAKMTYEYIKEWFATEPVTCVNQSWLESIQSYGKKGLACMVWFVAVAWITLEAL